MIAYRTDLGGFQGQAWLACPPAEDTTFNTRARINYYGDKNGLYRYSGCNGPVSAINGGPTTMNEHYRALRAPLPYIKFVERSVRVPTTGISSISESVALRIEAKCSDADL